MEYRMFYEDPTDNGSLVYIRTKDFKAKHDRDARRQARKFIHDLNKRKASKRTSPFKSVLTRLARVTRVRKVVRKVKLMDIPVS
jgi:hypothetical protein